MAKPGRNAPIPKPVHHTEVINERPIEKRLQSSTSSIVGDPNIPIRTVLYIEVGQLPPNDVRTIIADLTKAMNNEHPHYIVPTRSGKVTNEVVFEEQFMSVVKELCEIKDGEIVLKGGAQKMTVLRRWL